MIQNLQITSKTTTAFSTAECRIDGALNGVFSVSSTVITTTKYAGGVIGLCHKKL